MSCSLGRIPGQNKARQVHIPRRPGFYSLTPREPIFGRFTPPTAPQQKFAKHSHPTPRIDLSMEGTHPEHGSQSREVVSGDHSAQLLRYHRSDEDSVSRVFTWDSELDDKVIVDGKFSPIAFETRTVSSYELPFTLINDDPTRHVHLYQNEGAVQSEKLEVSENTGAVEPSSLGDSWSLVDPAWNGMILIDSDAQVPIGFGELNHSTSGSEALPKFTISASLYDCRENSEAGLFTMTRTTFRGRFKLHYIFKRAGSSLSAAEDFPDKRIPYHKIRLMDGFKVIRREMQTHLLYGANRFDRSSVRVEWDPLVYDLSVRKKESKIKLRQREPVDTTRLCALLGTWGFSEKKLFHYYYFGYERVDDGEV